MKISIIVVCYNSAETIEQTIYSIVNQTYPNINFVVIDGQSDDGTVEIIKKYADYIDYWSSEPDLGIYDAMNKGILHAEGEYIYFLGADDCLIDLNVLDRVAKLLKQDIDIFCGRAWGIDDDMSYLQRVMGRSYSREDIFSGEMSPHQGMFVKTALLKQMKFNIGYLIAADYDFFLKSLLLGSKIEYSDEIIAFYSLSGQSSQAVKCYDEYVKILNQNKIQRKYIDLFISLKVKNQNVRQFIKKCIKYLKIGKLIQKFRGYEQHHCQIPKCRWCKQSR